MHVPDRASSDELPVSAMCFAWHRQVRTSNLGSHRSLAIAYVVRRRHDRRSPIPVLRLRGSGGYDRLGQGEGYWGTGAGYPWSERAATSGHRGSSRGHDVQDLVLALRARVAVYQQPQGTRVLAGRVGSWGREALRKGRREPG